MPAAKKSAKKKGAAPEGFSFPKAAKMRSKSEVYRVLAEATGLPRRDVSKVFAAMSAMIEQDLGKLGMFTLPGLARITVLKKPATKARKGINPFTKQEQIFKAKPARKVVKLRPLKALKNYVA